MTKTPYKDDLLVKFISDLDNNQEIIAFAGSDSMNPTIKKGQEILITKTPFSKVKVGNIIAYALGRKKKVIVHRVIERLINKRKVYFITKGDNLPDKDGYKIDKESFIGSVRKI